MPAKNTHLVPILVRMSGHRSEALAAVNSLRGFPEGFPMSEFPDQESCESASLGIAEAQSKAAAAINQSMTAWVRIDSEGNAVEIIFPPNGVTVSQRAIDEE